MDVTADDGRVARSQRTRAAVLSAVLELITEGDPTPTAARVADRAGISTRSVYVHFRSLDELHCAAIEKVGGQVLERLAPIDAGLPLDARVGQLCGQRAHINEDLGPLLRAASLHAPTSSALTASRDAARKASRQQLDRIFAPELDAFDAATRRRRVAAADALVNVDAWSTLRLDLSAAEARVATEEALRALLAPPPPA